MSNRLNVAGLSFSVDNTTYFSMAPSKTGVEGYYSIMANGTSKTGGAPFDQPFFLLINLAVGGTFSGDPSSSSFPQSLFVDYVRISQL